MHLIERSEVVVIICSAGVLTRPWCLLELLEASQRGIPIVPLLIDGHDEWDPEAMRRLAADLPGELPKLNPGALMATAHADFLRLWRASWFNYSASDWDYNCCQVSFRLHAALGQQLRSHLRADLGPLPRYASEAEYDAHLSRAYVVHVTALSQPWRRRDSRRFGIMEKVSRLVLLRVNTSWERMTHAQRRCVELTAEQMQRRHARPGGRVVP